MGSPKLGPRGYPGGSQTRLIPILRPQQIMSQIAHRPAPCSRSGVPGVPGTQGQPWAPPPVGGGLSFSLHTLEAGEVEGGAGRGAEGREGPRAPGRAPGEGLQRRGEGAGGRRRSRKSHDFPAYINHSLFFSRPQT